MLAALTLVVLVSTGDGSAKLALREAAQEALGDAVTINVRAVAPLPGDDALVELLASNVDAVATIAWSDSAQRHAEIRLYRASTRRWLSREIEFSEADAVSEQGRTLGFALASMLPESGSDLGADSALAQVSWSEAAGTRRTAARGVVQATVGSDTSIDAAANAGVALGGAGDGLGGTLGAEVDLISHLGLRADLGVRAGHVERIEANTLALDLAPGVAWRAVDRPWGEPFAVELRLAVLGRYQSVAASDGAESHARWLPGLRVGAAGLWWFSPKWALLMTTALDSMFDETRIMRNGMRVSSFEPFALLMQLGVRTRL